MDWLCSVFYFILYVMILIIFVLIVGFDDYEEVWGVIILGDL